MWLRTMNRQFEGVLPAFKGVTYHCMMVLHLCMLAFSIDFGLVNSAC